MMADDSDDFDDFDDIEIEEEIITTVDSLDEETERDTANETETEQESDDDFETQPGPSKRTRKKLEHSIKWKKSEFQPERIGITSMSSITFSIKTRKNVHD